MEGDDGADGLPDDDAEDGDSKSGG